MSGVSVRDVVEPMDELRALEPDPGEARAAVERASAAARRDHALVRLRPSAPLGALAAVVVIMGAVVMWMSVGPAHAAGRLQEAAEAVRAYRGWVCVRMRIEGQSAEAVSYLNTATGESAWVDDPASPKRVVLEDPGAGARWDYRASAGEVHVTRLDVLAAEEHRSVTQQLLSVDGLTAAVTQVAGGAHIRGRRDGDKDRYDLTLKPGQECSVWVDRATGLIERVHGAQLFCFGTDATISYGGPGVSDVYALGVPRGTPVVDDRLAQRTAANGPRAPMDRGALLQLVRGERALLRDLSVSVRERTDREVPGMFNRAWYSVTVAGERVLMDDRINEKLEGERFAVEHRISFDGRQTVFWTKTDALEQVLVEPGRMSGTEIQAKQWFALNLLCPPKPGMNGVDDQSLESLLASGLSRVRPSLEQIDGRWCHVVEAPGGTFWLDVERGCVPLKQAFTFRGDADRPMMMFYADQVEQVKGMWFVTRGRKELSLPADSRMPTPEMRNTKWTIEVERNADGTPAIGVNGGVANDTFDLLKQVPRDVAVHRMEK